ncbi:MAG: hypothetical protein ABIZ49_03545 [Opitutaceae bacterium]
MTVRCQLLVVAALFALAFGAGCRNRDASQAIAETEEPAYLDGDRLKKQGRHAEALAAFIKVIESRGERPSPEAHLEAGLIYLYRLKDPLEAMHHFRKYLALKPNSKEADLVRGKYEEAAREFVRPLPARPLEDQSMRLQSAAENDRLRQENAELLAENAVLRESATNSAVRSPRGTTIDVTRLLSPAPVDPGQSAAIPPPSPGVPIIQAPPRAWPVQPTPTAPPPAPRTYTIRQSDGLLAIARQYDPKNPAAKMHQIIAANPDVLPEGAKTPLKPGMVLKIP